MVNDRTCLVRKAAFAASRRTISSILNVISSSKDHAVKILFVLTSYETIEHTGSKTGLWYEELAAPYYLLKDAGAEIVMASPKGGRSPIDPLSQGENFQTEYTHRFDNDQEAQAALSSTSALRGVKHDAFNAIFYPGGHGPIFDLPDNPDSIALIEGTYAAGKPVTMVCHAPAALRRVRRTDGKPLVAGKRVTGFTNSEEAAIGMTDAVPFLLEDELTKAGAHFEKAADWQPYSVQDGLLITGQNPASAVSAAKLLLTALEGSLR
jgi:putative intracellular protease/amidase